MSGIDIFVTIVCAIMLFGGLYLNSISRKLSNQYFETHRADHTLSKAPISKPAKR